MAIEKTLTILKPDCVTRGLMGKVIQRLEEAEFRICAAKMVHLTSETAGSFYDVHREKFFFPELIEFMTSAPVLVMVLQRENAVVALRELIGATNPQEAIPGTVRRELAEDKQRNIIHASDSLENAKVEIQYFFSKYEQLLTTVKNYG